jgi:hypothetical protein
VLADGSSATALFNLPAMLISAAATMLLIIGIQESARVNAVIVAIKVDGRAADHRSRRHVHLDRELASVHSAEHR